MTNAYSQWIRVIKSQNLFTNSSRESISKTKGTSSEEEKNLISSITSNKMPLKII